MKVPISEEEKKSPYYKYFQRNMAKGSAEKYEAIKAGPMDSSAALPVEKMNCLFEPGYHSCEFGYGRMPDHTLFVANLTDLPGVTVEMFDWWFAWHGLDPMRYKIWDPEDHYYCLTRNPDQAKDNSLSMRERLWDTIHDVKEDASGYAELGTKQKKPDTLAITFRNPADIGFDREKLAAFDGTIVCAANEKSPTIMCHFVRPTEKGCELRTRFWFGYCVKEGHPVKCMVPPPRMIPLSLVQGLLAHNVKEFTNLAAILPEVYEEFHDQF